MMNIKRIFAALLCLAISLSFAGCHKKDEIAVSAGDVKFTSAYYMAAFIDADSEAKSKVYEELSEEEQKAESIDYYSKKIDGKKYETWVKDTALATLKKIAAYKLLCAENKIELDDEKKSEAKTYADYYWSSYGYSMYYEPNGVSQATYTNYMTDSYYSSLYFDHLYAKDGEKEIAAKDVKSEIYKQFIIADVLNASYESEATDSDKAALKKQLKGYVEDLKNGKKTFEEVYNEYNKVEETDKKTEDEHDHEEETDNKEETKEPKDALAQVLGGEDTVYANDHYKTVKKMKTGEVKLIELEDKTGFVLVVKQDIKADDYYLDSLDSTARHIIADEEFEKAIEEYEKTFELKVNDYAVNQFKVKKIIEPDYSSMY